VKKSDFKKEALSRGANMDTISRWDVIEIMAGEIERVNSICPELPEKKRAVGLSLVANEYEAIMDIVLSLPPSTDGKVEGAPSPEEIDAMATEARGWTREVLAGWGVPWPPKRGWRKELIKKWESENG
jgi:hypothetical protein